jgi:hypothetical protein
LAFKPQSWAKIENLAKTEKLNFSQKNLFLAFKSKKSPVQCGHFAHILIFLRQNSKN